MKWEIVIGLETHAQLSTKSKIFSGASTAFGAEPNTQACAVDLALPGVLPVLNEGAVERAIRFGLAVGAKIAPRSIFARKNYFYPDLPKGYQISQYEIPVVQGGSLTFMVGDTEKTVRLTRAHLEEDAGKSLHEDFEGQSGIDLNRAGTPLLEIVTEPDMRSAEEAVAYAKKLHELVQWIGICDGNMQEGSFRCDANVSVRPAGSDKLGTRCEIKNLNSFRFMEQAINFEVRRQIELIEDGGTVVQETRLYDPDRDETRSMRSKEDAMDYRYFPDPDLLPLEIPRDWVEKVGNAMPELREAMCQRFIREYGVSEYAHALTEDKNTADYFETLVRLTFEMSKRLLAKKGSEPVMSGIARLSAIWLIGDVSAALNRDAIPIAQAPVPAAKLAGLLARELDQTITRKMAKDVFAEMWADNGEADAIIEKRGLKQISDSGEIEKIVDEVLAANAAQVADYKAGKEKAFNSLVGQVMKATRGKANPQQVNALLKQKLG
jgi:aspartyl-tRNA(Asn)/glutamyl-tRNA(Gln) amidotransferase subunit B